MVEFATPQEEAACTMLKQVLQNHIATYNLNTFAKQEMR